MTNKKEELEKEIFLNWHKQTKETGMNLKVIALEVAKTTAEFVSQNFERKVKDEVVLEGKLDLDTAVDDPYPYWKVGKKYLGAFLLELKGKQVEVVIREVKNEDSVG